MLLFMMAAFGLPFLQLFLSHSYRAPKCEVDLLKSSRSKPHYFHLGLQSPAAARFERPHPLSISAHFRTQAGCMEERARWGRRAYSVIEAAVLPVQHFVGARRQATAVAQRPCCLGPALERVRQ